MPRWLLILLVACRGGNPGPIPTIEIDADLPGASAETMASAVATPLERQLGQVAGLDALTSTSTLGHTRIRVGFVRDTDLDVARMAVQRASTAAANLLPRTLPAPPRYAMVGLHVARFRFDDPAQAKREARRLSEEPGVGRVELCGAPPDESWLGIDPVRLAAAGLTADEVVEAIRAARGGEIAQILIADHGAAIRVGDLTHPIAPRGSACRATDAKGDHIAIEVYARPDADLAALRARIGGALPAMREILVEVDPGPAGRGLRLAAAVAEAAGVTAFLVEDRHDSELVHVEVAGDGQAVASAAMHLQHAPGVVRAGTATTLVELDGADPAEVTRVAKEVAARFTARGTLVAIEGLGERPVLHATVDRDAASRLGITSDVLDRTLATHTGVVATTTFTQLDATAVIVAIDGDGPLYVRSTTGTLVPLDSVARVEEHAEPPVVLHAGQFFAVRLYTRDGDVGALPTSVNARIVPYR